MCLFCKIVEREIPAKIVYEDDRVLAFEDINPQAPKHVLVIPKAHISSLDAADEEQVELLGYVQLASAKVARLLGISESGYRLISNCGSDGGQTVFHLHYHLVGGKSMGWPPFPKGE
mgnify:CR=1 FL=1